MDALNIDVNIEIFKLLSTKDLLKCIRVSKSWQQFIKCNIKSFTIKVNKKITDAGLVHLKGAKKNHILIYKT